MDNAINNFQKMKNLTFVIWMLGYPITSNLSSYLTHLATGIQHTDPLVLFLSAITNLIIWFYVGYKLYVPPKKIN